MAKIKVYFDNENYQIDESSFSDAYSKLQSHLSNVMNGSGATIKFGDTSYNVDSTKLQNATNDFTSHLRTIAGNGRKVIVNGIEYSIDFGKVQGAVAELKAVLGNSNSDDSDEVENNTGDAYAIYDSNSKTLYFTRSETPIEEGTTLEISGGRTINTSNVYSSIENFEAENFTKVLWYNNNKNITTVEFLDEIRPVYTNGWFTNFNKLTNIIGIEKLNTSNTVNMSNMFNGTRRLSQLDVSHFDTSNVTDMTGMFGYAAVESLDLSNFDTSNVVNMASMFNGYTSLKTLILDGWDTSNVTSMNSMFANCSSLETLDISHFNTAKVKDMSAMFSKCTTLVLDCSDWNVENVTAYTSFNDYAPKVVAPNWAN